MRVKGFTLIQSLIESVLILSSITGFLVVLANFKANTEYENRKLNCAIANMSYAEVIKGIISISEDVESVINYREVAGKYETLITSFNYIELDYALVYRLTVDTSYEGEYYEETELVIYINDY